MLRQRFQTHAGEIAWDRLGDGPPVVMVRGTPWSVGSAGQAALHRQIVHADQRDTEEVGPLHGRIAVPTIAIGAELDRWFPGAPAAELAGRIPGATLPVVRGAGHLVQEDAPGQLDELPAGHVEH